MSYGMYLSGELAITPPLQGIHVGYLDRFKRIRHMKREVSLLEKLRDPLREAVGLPIGEEGAYYVAGKLFFYEHDDSTIINYNTPPIGQPGLWNGWEPTGDGEFLFWNGSEKNFDYQEWLKYLIAHFFKPWNYRLSGEIERRYSFYKYIHPNGDEDDEENEVEVHYVEKSELIVKDDNLVIENDLGTFAIEE